MSKTPPQVFFSEKPFRGTKTDTISSICISHFTHTTNIQATVRTLLTFNTSAGTFILIRDAISHETTLFPFSGQSDNSYKQKVRLRVTLLLLLYFGDYNLPHHFPSTPSSNNNHDNGGSTSFPSSMWAITGAFDIYSLLSFYGHCNNLT